MQDGATTRREFLGSSIAAVSATPGVAATAATRRTAPRIKLGLDNFSVRGFRWNAERLIDYSAALGLDSLFISDLDAIGSLDAGHLASVRARADERGLDIHLGTWSICPTSKSFRKNRGTAAEHLALGLRVAKALGSPVLRVILGNMEDRLAPGGIDRHIDETVKVLRGGRSVAESAGVKIAVENHAGDLHSTELVGLIEQAGKEFVGCNLDSGNALWTLEDPLDSLINLGPHVLTSSLRDGVAWDYEEGAKIQWTAMGEGQVNWPAYFARFADLCPGVPVHIETISGFARPFAYLKPEFWAAWPKRSARDFARFLAMARRGKPPATVRVADAKSKEAAEQIHQRGEIERSLRYCKETIGLGVRGR